MRLFTATISVLLVAGCASPPRDTAADAAAANVVRPPDSAVVASAPSDGAGAQTAAVKGYPGYKPKQRNGTTVYCKKLARIGSNFSDEVCLTAAELDQINARTEEDRAQFRRNQTLCGTGGCGGS